MADSLPRRRANVLTIPPGVAFLPTLARGLLDGEVVPGFAPRGDPIALADATIYLPTRRAARALREAFLEALDGRATLLPRIAPLGDVDEDESLAEPLDGADDELPPPSPPLMRRLALARLVFGFAATLDRSILKLAPGDGPLIPATASEAIHLAGDLEALIDAIETEEIDISGIDALVPGEHDEYWAITQRFLQVALRAWPEHVENLRLIDPSRRRRLQIETAAARAAQARGPVIAAGSTGSVPATRRLIATIAGLDHGAVVLPGLDRDGLEDESWADLLEGDGPGVFGHPQRGLASLVRALGLARSEVRELGAAPAPLAARARLAADALRPADTTDAWSAKRPRNAEIAEALDGVSLIEAPHARGEALAIAIALREAIETPGKTAALVTPDRDLAGRVSAELERWAITIDDSAGRPLAATPAGALMRLTAEAAIDPRPAAVLALLRAPACRLVASSGLPPRALDCLDATVLRAPLPGEGFAGLRTAIRRRIEDIGSGERERRPRGVARRFAVGDLGDAHELVERLADVLAPLTLAAASANAPLAGLADGLSQAYQALNEGAESEDAQAAALFLEELGDASSSGDPIAPAAFPGVLEALMAGRVVRPPRDRHPRLRILGPLEARLIRFDLMVLGGLNEGTWPAVPQADPWINRPLRAALGLPPPERRIGLSAHDFSQGFGADEVILSRAAKVGGAPTIPSRWLQRLAAVAAGPAYEAAKARGKRYVDFADELDNASRDPAPKPPEPRPAVELRPRGLSVTSVETWLRDPYSIYARHILKLDEIEPVGPEPDPRDLGNAIHGALEDFAKSGAKASDPDAAAKLLALGETRFGDLLKRDDARTLWWPRFVRIVDWIVAYQAERERRTEASYVEQAGALEIPTASGRGFTLSARADRIDAFADGTFAFLDYKTGSPPTLKQVLTGFAPQLPLEGAILKFGGFADAAPGGGVIGELSLVRLLGREPVAAIVSIQSETEGPDEVAAKALARFRAVVEKFEKPEQPYLSLSHPQFLKKPEGPYAHLARVKEWSATGGEIEGDLE